jgi:formiminoglutamate deiminase
VGGDGLAEDVLIETQDGDFTAIVPNADDDGSPRLEGVVVPGLVNAHSHAFHRLLRGRTHRLGGDFWLWRELMYETAAALTPETYEVMATAVFIEMAMAGVTTVGEFHYVHHQVNGSPYSDHNEMGHALVRAARTAGIRICLLDAGYFTAGFGDTELSPVQQRFRDPSPEDWLERAAEIALAYTGAPDVTTGVAPHSVRAVPPEALRTVARRRDTEAPVHIHVSEQPSENRDCEEATGTTPTGLLDECGLLGATTTLVHATHLTPDDIGLIGGSSSRVCYCATTERDLGDGIGPAAALADSGAQLCVGSDSHAMIDLFEEARGIELHQRLATGSRGLFSPANLLRAATVAGSQSLEFEGGLRPGRPADFIVIDTDSPRLAGFDVGHGLDSVVFAATSADVRDVFVGGRQIVTDGSHSEWARAKWALTGSI